MDGQDWEPVVFRKSAPTTDRDARSRGLTMNGVRKSGGSRSNGAGDGQRLAKLDREEVGTHKKVSKATARAIQQGRLAKKMSQKEFAQKINAKPEVVASYESGKAQPNQQVLNKMSRVLGVTLSGK